MVDILKSELLDDEKGLDVTIVYITNWTEIQGAVAFVVILEK